MFTSKDIMYLDDKINSLLNDYAIKNNIDINDYNFRTNIKHLEVMNIFRYINKHLFYIYKDSSKANQSNIDFNDSILFEFLCNKFLDICNYFNKSLGLESFAVFIGVNRDTLYTWMKDEAEESSPTVTDNLRKIYNYNQDALISNLKNTPLGMVAVANNDKGTGLEWTKNQAPQVAKDTVYFLPSERLERLRLENSGADVREA